METAGGMGTTTGSVAWVTFSTSCTPVKQDQHVDDKTQSEIMVREMAS